MMPCDTGRVDHCRALPSIAWPLPDHCLSIAVHRLAGACSHATCNSSIQLSFVSAVVAVAAGRYGAAKQLRKVQASQSHDRGLPPYCSPACR